MHDLLMDTRCERVKKKKTYHINHTKVTLNGFRHNRCYTNILYIYIHTRLLETMVSFRVKETRVGLKIKISQVTKDFLPLNFGIAVSRS